MTEQKIDPELVDDLDTRDEEVEVAFDMPEYDPTQFELAEDFEYEEDGEEDASEA
jgi:hypothetical protein